MITITIDQPVYLITQALQQQTTTEAPRQRPRCYRWTEKGGGGILSMVTKYLFSAGPPMSQVTSTPCPPPLVRDNR